MKKRIISVLLAIMMIGFSSSVYCVQAQENQNTSVVHGKISGIIGDDYSQASMVLYSGQNSFVSSIDKNGNYSFDDIPNGSYYLKIELEGYSVFSPLKVEVGDGNVECDTQSVDRIENTSFYYHWIADESYFGYEEQANVVVPYQVNFSGEKIYICDSAASIKLANNYNLFLVNNGVNWTSDYASRLNDLFEDVWYVANKKPSVWMISQDHIHNNVEILYGENGDIVTVSVDAFTNAIPKLADIEGTKGSFFSNALFDVIVRYLTKNGTDIDAVDRIMRERYGCSVIINDYESLVVTGETAAAFEQFKPEELVSIICMFEEMPIGFHKVNGLDYLVRRIDGSRNPIYPKAAAVSWVYAQPGYIEFMDDAFLGDYIYDTFRLILHEKTHFLWKNVFNEGIKQEWIRIGGWIEDPSTGSGWSTTKQTEFVTAYSHDHNPDEDMAESVAFYILDPNLLRARSENKYNFIRNYIMNGEIYITTIREDLTFEVYNLYPDYAYPGRIVEFKAEVTGDAEEDKTVKLTVKLDTHGDPQYGASGAFMRIETLKCEQFYDLRFSPQNGDNSILEGYVTISKYSAAGYWMCTGFDLYDNVGNERFANKNNFGWKLYIDNPLEDLVLPQYVDDSIVVSSTVEELDDGHVITHVKIEAEATDNIGIKQWNGFYTEIANNTHDSYRMDKWGYYNPETGKCEVTYDFSEYYHSGEYSINYLMFVDLAGNRSGYNFFSDNSGAKSYTTFEYESSLSDYEAPELDVNRISISAVPTHPDAPNGETIVTIKLWIRDNKSGFDYGNFTLLDPQGNTFFDYFYTENYYSPYFIGDPTEWKEYTITKILPEGSAPGIWGLEEISINDRGGNQGNYSFLEIVHFVALDDDVEFDENIDKTTDKITYKSKGFKYSIVDSQISEAKELIVKRTYNNLNVVSVGEGAFENTSLESITFLSQSINIYDSATTIGEGVTIKGYKDSTAEKYALKYERNFDCLGTLGDVNGDGVLNGKDATRLLQYFAHWDVNCEELLSDVNGDGVINGKDATRLLQYLAHWDVVLGS